MKTNTLTAALLSKMDAYWRDRIGRQREADGGDTRRSAWLRSLCHKTVRGSALVKEIPERVTLQRVQPRFTEVTEVRSNHMGHRPSILVISKVGHHEPAHDEWLHFPPGRTRGSLAHEGEGRFKHGECELAPQAPDQGTS